MARTDPRPTYGTGRRVEQSGYVQIWAPGHPIARKDGYVLEHRKVVYDAGLLIDPSLHVHHINGDKQDNRLENLQAITAGEHQRIHHMYEEETYNRWRLRVRAELGERACCVCGADITALRIDAVVCGERCRINRWKRAKAAERRAARQKVAT